MARIRTIKPEFPQSESMGRVSRDARLTFIELWTLADDDGRLRGNSALLAGLLFPYDDDARKKIDGWLSELEREQCIVRYRIGADSYIAILNWSEHQKIDHPKPSKIPPPPSDTLAEPVANVREDSREPDEASRTFALDQGRDQGPRTKDQGGDREVVAGATDPIAEAFDEWNALAEQTGLPAVQNRSDKRRSALKARLSEAGGLEGWRLALAKIRGSPFLLGQGNGRDHPNWRADFDFIVRADKFTKLMEGGYDGRPEGTRQSDSDRLKAGIAAAFGDLAEKPATH